MKGFDRQDPVRPSIVQRVLRRRSPENAFVEINNALAEGEPTSWPPSFVQDKLEEYRVRPEDSAGPLGALYGQAVHAVARSEVQPAEEHPVLVALRQQFGLTNIEAKNLRENALAPLFTERVEATMDAPAGAERARQTATEEGARLALSTEAVNRLYGALAQRHLQALWNEAIADRRLSDEEDEQLTSLAHKLGVTLEYDRGTEQLAERMRTLWRIEHGQLPILEAPILLQKKEVCHASIMATHYESRTVTRAIRYGGPTMRVRIAKGVSYRFGQIGVQRVQQDVLTEFGTGTLYVTSKRLLFDGSRRNVAINLTRILGFTMHADGITIEKDSGKPQVFLCTGDLEVFGAALDGALAAARQ